jgi:hypothetical protein
MKLISATFMFEEKGRDASWNAEQYFAFFFQACCGSAAAPLAALFHPRLNRNQPPSPR